MVEKASTFSRLKSGTFPFDLNTNYNQSLLKNAHHDESKKSKLQPLEYFSVPLCAVAAFLINRSAKQILLQREQEETVNNRGGMETE